MLFDKRASEHPLEHYASKAVTGHAGIMAAITAHAAAHAAQLDAAEDHQAATGPPGSAAGHAQA
jgi:hypothetical protein